MRRAVGAAAVVGLALAGTAGAPADAALSGPSVAVVDNAFVRGVQRPTVTIRTGQQVTWRWRSRQSHSVTVRSGPERFVARERTRGRFSHRFVRTGTYRLECELHAPGMKMTVVVRR